MSTQLFLRIDEDWPARPACAWILLGPDGKIRAEGESDPRHWPAADSCSVVLAGSQCLWLETTLPRAARRDEPRLLAYALEDKLLSDPDSQHLTVTHRRPDTAQGRQVGVLVVARERLRQLLAQFKAIGRPLARCVAEIQTAPAAAGEWRISVAGQTAILRISPDQGLAADGDLLPAVLAAQQAAARASNAEAARIVVHCAPGSPAPLPGEDCAFVAGESYRWWAGAAAADNLLHDEFAVAGQQPAWLAALRGPALLFLAAALLWLLAGLGEVAWRKYRLADVEARMTRSFVTAVPDQPAVAPAAQMRRLLNVERARHGLLGDDDALALLATVGDALGEAQGSLAGLRYAEGRLDLTWHPGFPVERLENLKAQLAARGLLAEIAGEAGAPQLRVRTEGQP